MKTCDDCDNKDLLAVKDDGWGDVTWTHPICRYCKRNPILNDNFKQLDNKS